MRPAAGSWRATSTVGVASSRYARVRLDPMRVAVVGHVEWVEFARVERVPDPGEIVHALETGRSRREAAPWPRCSSRGSPASACS